MIEYTCSARHDDGTGHTWLLSQSTPYPSGEATGGTYVEVVAGGGEDYVVSVGLRKDRRGPLPEITAWRAHLD